MTSIKQCCSGDDEYKMIIKQRKICDCNKAMTIKSYGWATIIVGDGVNINLDFNFF